MQARDLTGPAIAFVVIVAVVVGGAAVMPLVTGGDTPEVTNLAERQTDLDAVRVDPAEESGEISMDSDASSKTILVDRAHGNQLSEEKLSTLTATLVENGHEVRFVTQEQARGGAWNQSLRNADALLVANPGQPYTPEQLAGVREFNEAGGRVVLLSDPASSSGASAVTSLLGLSVQQPASGGPGLSSSLGVAARSGYLFNMHEYQHNFESVYATSGSGSLSQGVDRVVFHDARAVTSDRGQTALSAIERTRLSTTRRADTYAVAAQSGDAAIVGDTDFLAPTNAYVADNEAFVGNLADFLVSGQKTSNAPSPPSPAQGESAPSAPSRPVPTA
ncbi:GldG family protein [Halobellus rarus]|uniref:GldG family protein n=1 Tax=Halobellus rarus TaxID=1126237 RepID=A0ABD6CNQ9_9EURY|nr:GldG family protein [Halobellus rarus]